jgi:hypothetical protein
MHPDVKARIEEVSIGHIEKQNAAVKQLGK